MASSLDNLAASIRKLRSEVSAHNDALFNIVRGGGSSLSSRPYSLLRLAKALAWNDPGLAKIELSISEQLSKAFHQNPAYRPGWARSMLVPLAPRHLQVDSAESPGVSVSLQKECADLVKDLSGQSDTSGATLIPHPAQSGGLIDHLRAASVFDRATEVSLPFGSLHMPGFSSSATLTTGPENTTLTESTPTTSNIVLSAKKY